jgi:hypothetical protein
MKKLHNTFLLLCPIVVLGFAPRCSQASDVAVGCGAGILNEAAVVGVNSAYESALRASDTDALQRLLAPD